MRTRSVILIFAAIAATAFLAVYVLSQSIPQPYYYKFDGQNQIEEAGRMDYSKNHNWWLSSGGLLLNNNGTGSTIQGDLAPGSKWQLAYAASNPKDTDDGRHPQNIFRLVGRQKWQNFQQQVYFKVIKDNLSASPDRNESNGLFLFNCYRDDDNLYYAGIRVDGAAVIKKKKNGVYYEMRYSPVFSSNVYNRDNNPDLIPKNEWIGLRTEVIINDDGSLGINLYMDRGRTGEWALIASANDNGSKFGGALIKDGYGGIRTDFMDVQFSDYSIAEF